MIEVIAAWSLSFSFSMLWVRRATVPRRTTLSHLAAETIGWVAKLIRWGLWWDHVSNLLLLSSLKH